MPVGSAFRLAADGVALAGDVGAIAKAEPCPLKTVATITKNDATFTSVDLLVFFMATPDLLLNGKPKGDFMGDV